MLKMKLGTKLMATFFLIGGLPLLVMGVYSIHNATLALKEQNRNHRLSVDCIKKDQVEALFENHRRELSALVETVIRAGQIAGPQRHDRGGPGRHIG